MLARWRERDVFHRSLANREGAEVWSFYEGPPTANGRPGSHHVLARVFKDVYPRYKTMCGYRVPRKAGWDCHGLPVELEVEKQLGISSKQEIEEYGIAEFNAALPRVGLRVRRGVEPADRADRLLDRPRRPLRHPRRRLHRVGLVVAAPALGRGPPLRGPQGRPLLPALRHRALLARGRAGLQGRRGPLHLRALPAARRGRRARRASRCWSGRRRPGRCPATSPSPSAPDVTYVRARVGGETLILAEPLVEKVLGEGAEIARPLARRRPGRPPLRAARSSTSPTASRGALPGPRRRLRHHRGRHRPRPHRPRLRRGRLRGRRRERDLRPDRPRHASTTRSASTARFDRPRRRLRGPLRQGPRGHPRR